MRCEDVGIVYTEIAGQIDRLDSRSQTRNDVHRLAVRQREERDIHIVQSSALHGSRLKHQVRQAKQVPMNIGDSLPGVFVSGHKSDLDIGMKQQDTEQLTAAVPGAAEDRNANLHAASARMPA